MDVFGVMSKYQEKQNNNKKKKRRRRQSYDAALLFLSKLWAELRATVHHELPAALCVLSKKKKERREINE